MNNNNEQPIDEIKNENKKRGRKALMTDEQFINAHKNAKNIDEIINLFPALQAKDSKKAKLYVSMRASNLRKRGLLSNDSRFTPGPKADVSVTGYAPHFAVPATTQSPTSLVGGAGVLDEVLPMDLDDALAQVAE